MLKRKGDQLENDCDKQPKTPLGEPVPDDVDMDALIQEDEQMQNEGGEAFADVNNDTTAGRAEIIQETLRFAEEFGMVPSSDDSDMTDTGTDAEEEEHTHTLAEMNAHPRDSKIYLEPIAHTYFVDGKPLSIGATTFKAGFFPSFDSERILKMMFKNTDSAGRIITVKGKYGGCTRGDVLKRWNRAAIMGTGLHDAIERYLDTNVKWYKKPFAERQARLRTVADDATESLSHSFKELDQFLAFEDEFTGKLGWEVFSVEQCIYDEDIGLAGTMDATYRRKKPDGTYEHCIVDWKRCIGKLSKANYPKTALWPIQSIPNTKLGGYGLQVSIYAAILRKHYNIDVTTLVLAQFAPDAPNYQMHYIKEHRSEVSLMFKGLTDHRALKKKLEDWATLGKKPYDFLPEASSPMLRCK